MHTIQVFNENEKIIPTHVRIDGIPIKCRSIDYHADLESVPEFTFEIPSLSIIEVSNANIRFRFDSKSVIDAVKILRHELTRDKDMWDGFAASIRSALNDYEMNDTGIRGAFYDAGSLAEFILGRITGIEDRDASSKNRTNVFGCNGDTGVSKVL